MPRSKPPPSRRERTPDQSRSAARQRLDLFAVEWFVEKQPQFAALGIGPINYVGLREAAELVLEDVQEQLLMLQPTTGGAPLERDVARHLARDRFRAVTALLQFMTSKQAKQEQLRIAEGAPVLAICTGDVCRIGHWKPKTLKTPFVDGDLQFAAKGCHRIFPDATGMVGDMWPAFCAECNNSRRQPVRDQRRALARRINHAVRTPTIYDRYATRKEIKADLRRFSEANPER